jgi:2'-5' RNA ligase
MRVFVAIDIKDDNSINNMIRAQRDILAYAKGAKPVSKEQLHFTLLFIGEVNDLMLNSIKDRLSSIRFEPINVEYKGIGVFPSISNARVVWVGVDEYSAIRLKGIAKEVERLLLPLGFKSDKEFTPHITLLRIKDRIRDSMFTSTINKYKDVSFGSEILDEIKIKKSDLLPTGPVYTDLFNIRSAPNRL